MDVKLQMCVTFPFWDCTWLEQAGFALKITGSLSVPVNEQIVDISLTIIFVQYSSVLYPSWFEEIKS